MNTGIICEFNPFHSGHKYLIDSIKSDGAVICVMSGNFVQRGEFAIYDKFKRCDKALENGADIVIELPCVYSLMSAEGFANAGVTLLEKTGIVDEIAFGTECDDINKLKEKNSDTVGWINVNNTNINYPYVQGKDNNYYLDHSFDKKYNEAGWVFLDYRNDKNLSNKNNILYAHSRLDKTMFGSLSKTLKSNWYNNKDNHIIRLSTETENTMWQIFSVYKIPEETYYITTNFNSDNDYQKFLNTIKERSIHNFSTNLTTEDKILTLSTCYSDTERTVVHAKLIKRSPK